MPEPPDARNEGEMNDPGALWRAQSPEELLALPAQLLNRRTGALLSGTRAEILCSLGAGVFFVLILTSRFELRTQPLVLAGAGLILCWILITIYWFRERIWPPDDSGSAALGAPALAFYRAGLERRKKHLGSAWVWSGPLLLACATLAAILLRDGNPRRLCSILPLLALLAIWTAAGIRRRRRLASEIQNELDELARL